MTDDVAQEQPGLTGRDPNVLISLVACTATAALALSADGIWHAVRERPGPLLAFVGLALVLQLVSIELYGHGSFSFGGVGLLALGFTFGSSPAMAVGALMGVANLVARRRHGARLNRGVFDAAQFSLAAGAGAAVFDALAGPDWSAAARILPSIAAGVAYMVVNIGLLSLTIALAEGESQVAVWRERFRWLTPYFLAAGPLALGLVVAYENVGLPGLIAFALPPALHDVLDPPVRVADATSRSRRCGRRTRSSSAANAQLAESERRPARRCSSSPADSPHARTTALRSSRYAEHELSRLDGVTGGDPSRRRRGRHRTPRRGTRGSAALHLEPRPDCDGRALEPAARGDAAAARDRDRERRPRRGGPAAASRDDRRALARRMEAKDYYTGGHTSASAEIAVALAARLGYAGEELDAIEIGALLHDIGKIGIPERILHKPGPLDEEEWKVMKEHPVISDYILSEVDLHPIVMPDRTLQPRAHRRYGLPGRARRRGDPAACPDRARRRRLRRADERPAVSFAPATVAAAMDELRAHAGTQFCPEVVAALEAVHREQPQILGAARLRAVGGAAA